jgi:hypothetical protein
MEISDMTENGSESLQELARERMTQVRDRLANADRQLRRTVETYPLTTLLGVVLFGYLCGRLASRR